MNKLNKDYPLVSIVAVCYNHERFVQETLDSISNQTYKNTELIIIDDCSEDNSVDVIRSWIEKNNMDCIFIPHKQNRGLSWTLNEALGTCAGYFFKPIACDDLIDKNFIEVLVKELLRSENNVSAIMTDCRVISEDGTIINESYLQSYNIPEVDNENQFRWYLNFYYPAIGALFKTNWVRKVGGYDENILTEDVDLCLRLLRESKIIFKKQILSSYRKVQIDSTSLSHSLKNNRLIFHRNRIAFLKKHLDSKYKDDVIAAIILQVNRAIHLDNCKFSDIADLIPKFSGKDLIALLMVRTVKKYYFNKNIIQKIYRK